MDEKLCLRKNVGAIDRVIRITIGSLLIVIPAVLHSSPLLIALLAAIGGVQIFEGLISY